MHQVVYGTNFKMMSSFSGSPWVCTLMMLPSTALDHISLSYGDLSAVVLEMGPQCVPTSGLLGRVTVLVVLLAIEGW